MSTPPFERGPRVRTVVWGVILAALGGGMLAVALGARIDLELAAIGLLAFAGLALLVGSLATAFRRRDDDPSGRTTSVPASSGSPAAPPPPAADSPAPTTTTALIVPVPPVPTDDEAPGR